VAREQPELAAELTQMEQAMDLAYVRENLDRLFTSSLGGLQRIRSIVDNLRTFARLDEAGLKEVDLNAALQSTLEVLRHELDEKRLQVQTSLPELPPIFCQPGKIGQLFFNILLNAIQASQPEGLIEVRTRPDPSGGVLVEIEDHGCGIPPEQLPHIYEPFFTTKPVGAGTGLGLAVSYGIIRDHNGSIDVESTVGRGSLFRIRLPLRAPEIVGGSSPATA
jgi:signal transduction histidine kinase